MTDYLTIDQILASDDLLEEDIEIPEWSGKLRIRALSAEEATEVLQLSSRGQGKKASVDSRSAIFHSVRLGTVIPKIDATLFAALMKKSAKPVFALSQRIQELSGFTLEDEEELEKNS